MGRYIVRRLIQSFFVVLGVVILVFLLARLTGDPAVLYLPLLAPEELREAFREEHGLNQPIMVQLGQFLWNAAHLDFGESMWQHRPAMPVVLSRLPLTLELATITVAIAFGIAFVLGTLASLRPLSVFDRVVSAVSLTGMTVPPFWLGLMLMMVFAVHLDLVPTSGTGGLEYALLPAITLTWPILGRLAQVVRSSMLEQISATYVVTARAKG
jgi:peptide/nickel transport system permease protein